jgi:hypothetical protein
LVEAKGYLPVPDKPCAPMAMKMSMHRNDALCIVANAAASKACDSTTPEFPFYRYGGGRFRVLVVGWSWPSTNRSPLEPFMSPNRCMCPPCHPYRLSMAKPSREHWDQLAKDFGMTADVEKAWKARTDFKACWLANAQVPGQPKKPEKQEEVIHSSGPNKRQREDRLHSLLVTPEQLQQLHNLPEQLQQLHNLKATIVSILDANKSSG